MLKKLTLTLLLAASAAALLPARAAEVIVDGIKYSTDTYTHTASVIQYDSSNNAEFYKGEITIPETITVNDQTYTVTTIDYSAFQSCNELTSVSLPKTVTTLYGYAFYYCEKLKSVGDLSMIKSIDGCVFQHCTSLSAIGDMPNLTSLGEYAFDYCINLESLGNMPALTAIESCTFRNCKKLTRIGDISAVTSVGSQAFNNCSSSLIVTFKDVSSIGNNALQTAGAAYIFEGQTPPTFNSSCGLTSSNLVVVPDESAEAYSAALSRFGVGLWTQNEYAQIPETTDETIHDYVISTSALNATSALNKELIKANGKDVKPLVHSLKVIGSINSPDFATIRSLSNLTTLDLSEATIEGNAIPDNGLSELPSLQSVSLPEDLTSIGKSAFNNCTSLSSIGDLPNLQSIGSCAFSRCTALKSIGSLNSLTSIGSYAFSYYSNSPAYCTSLTSIGETPKLETIGVYAFYRCSKLEALGDLPNLQSIGSYAFSRCTALKSIGSLNALTSIGSSAFSGCTALKSIGSLNALTSIGSYAFSDNSYSPAYCTSLTSIGETPKLETIGSGAFMGCSITEFNLPESLTSVSTSAFSEPALVHFAGATPPTFSGASISTLICVPAGCETAYAEALPDMLPSKILTHGTTDFDVTVSARENDSDVLIKVNEGFDKDMALNVLNLKVTGTINSYDIIVFRNKMLNLRKLDLSDATIVGSSYEYYSGCHTEDNVVGNYMFKELNLNEVLLPKNAISIGVYAFAGSNNLTKVQLPDSLRDIKVDAFYYCQRLESITFPATIQNIGREAFCGCSNLQAIYFPPVLDYHDASFDYGVFKYCFKLKSVTLPYGVSTIVDSNLSGRGVFQDCRSLEEVTLPPTLKNIPSYCFSGCSSLKTVVIPPTLQSIGANAFSGCTSLTEFRIPAGVNSIGNGAIPGTVKDVYTYTIQPTSIGENTFESSTYLTATLHVPETSERLYYWDTQWSQFQSIENFNEPYSYFYLDDKDLIEDPDTPRIEGETNEETGEKTNPDADLGSGSGLVVEGDDSQDLGNVDIDADGKGNGTTIIGGDSSTSESGGNVNIDMLNVNIPITGNRWYFFAFPFDVPCENIKFNGQMVWRYYDGEWRAMNGSGAWKNMKGEKLERGRGYIFQGSKNGTLTISVPNVSFNGQDWTNILEQFVSANAQDASWNFIGNPFLSFYELADLGFDGPITWWNPNTNSYEALSPEDDDLSMYPFMAFFVQKPEGTDGVDFFSNYQETNNQKNDPNHRAAARRRRAARRTARSLSDRKIINLTVTDGTNSDRTRVVFNSQASAAYEVGTDASKFISTEAPQIYSLDAENVRYAINERPAADGVVNLGFYAPADGAFTLECTRTDCELSLKDLQSGKVITLTPGTTYEFTAKKGYDDSRFVLTASGTDVTAIDAINAAEADATYYRVNGLETDGSQRGLMIEVKNGEATKVVR